MYLAKCDALFVKILYIGINKKLNKPYYYILVSNNCSANSIYHIYTHTKMRITKFKVFDRVPCKQELYIPIGIMHLIFGGTKWV